MIEDVLNANRPDLVGEVCASECRLGGAVLGLDALARAFARQHAMYSGYRLVVDEMVAEGDAVVVRGSFRGTHTGDVAIGGVRVPPTGKPVECRVFALFRIEDGKVAEEIAMGDDLGLLKQLGYAVVPADSVAAGT
jgi:predicted ester cyclase